MKDAKSILDYIDRLYSEYGESPNLYAVSAISLEDIFIQFEILRAFILDVEIESTDISDIGYFQFLRDKHPECGVSRYATYYVREYGSSSSSKDTFKAFVATWKEYLGSGYRPARKVQD